MMHRAWPLIAVGAIIGLAACQPGTGPSQVPSSNAPASTTPSASVAPSSSASSAVRPSAAAQLVAVHGEIFADGGDQVPNAQIDVQCTQYPQLNGTYPAPGGAYYLGNVPVGAALRLRASATGYGVRERMFTAAYDAPDTLEDPNLVDFGGPNSPLFGLSTYPDILEVSPANGDKGISPHSLSVKFTFSLPILGDQQHQFGRLVRVRIPVPHPSPSASDYQDLEVGTSFGNQAATLSWNASGTVATLDFNAPIAVSGGVNSATIMFDQTAPLSQWPTGSNGLKLGFESVAKTYDGGGALVYNQIAPFQRDLTTNAIPSPSPGASPDDIWGLAHATTSGFAFASDTTPVHVTSVNALPPSGSVSARFVVVFDQPMQGFPTLNLDSSVYSAANYRFTVGKTIGAADQQAFNASDPTVGGQSGAGTPYFADGTYNTLVVPVSDTAFGDNTAFKFYVAPAVKDAFGGAVAPTVIEGTLP